MPQAGLPVLVVQVPTVVQAVQMAQMAVPPPTQVQQVQMALLAQTAQLFNLNTLDMSQPQQMISELVTCSVMAVQTIVTWLLLAAVPPDRYELMEWTLLTFLGATGASQTRDPTPGAWFDQYGIHPNAAAHSTFMGPRTKAALNTLINSLGGGTPL
jgi:hypothetical protein